MPSLDELFPDAELARVFPGAMLDLARHLARRTPPEDLTVEPGVVEGWVGDDFVSVEWLESRNGLTVSHYCDCGARNPCIHLAVLIVSARRTTDPATGHATSRWRRILDPISRLADEAAERTPLAVRISVVHRRPQWGDRTPYTTLAAVPVRVGRSGRWAKTGAKWRDLMRTSPYDDLVVAQREALAALATTIADSWSLKGDTVALDNFGPTVLPLLTAATGTGVQLLGAHDRPDLISVSTEPVTFELHVSGPDGGDLSVRPGFLIPATDAATHEEPVRQLLPAQTAGLIGRHAAFWLDDKEVLHLAPLTEPIAASLASLAMAPPVVVPAADAAEFRRETGARLARLTPVSAERPSLAIAAAAPPRLVLQVSFDPTPAVRLAWGFGYGPDRVDPVHHRSGGARDAIRERELVNRLDLLSAPHLRSVIADGLGAPRDGELRGHDVLTLFDRVLPWLVERGVELRLNEGVPEFREATEDPVITLTVDEAQGAPDWYDLGVSVSIEGEVIAFAELFTALAAGAERLLLPSGLWLRLDRPEFEQLRTLIAEARGLVDASPTEGGIRVNRYQSDWWQELSALGVIERQSAEWAAAMTALGTAQDPRELEVPSDIRATLRPYQVAGFSWLAFLHEHDLGGILADDMGLGKTLQMLALFAHVRRQAPDARFLVVAPTSVVGNWRHEAAQFAPDLPVVTITQTRQRRGGSIAEVVGDAAIVVTSYTLLRLESEQYQEVPWQSVVLDEAQFVKNRKAKTYRCVRELTARSKFAITGTPLENSLMDLWSLLSITAPGLYPDPDRFAEVYRAPIESGAAPELLAVLRRRMAPLMRRRTKEQVVAELPPKTEQELAIDLGTKHLAIYQQRFNRERQKVLGLIGDLQKNRFEIFRSLTLLRQLALDPALVSDEYEGVGSAKLDQLLAHLTEVSAEGHRALVFSQFTRFLGRVRARLDEAGIAYSYLDGSTRDRDRVITSFKQGDAPVFLISLKSGGFGLNLTEADYCFVLDPWWNPAAEMQAVDRAHRIGQTRPVMVYRYVSAGTIEEKVMALKAHKQAIFDSVVGDADAALAGALTADDIRGLLD